jgi:hypothetical protein
MAMKEDIYKEVGTNYRFFLGWRQAAFAGYLVVVGAVMSLSISAFKDARAIAWIIPLCASPIGVLLWIVEVRTRALYHATIRAGKDLEAPEKGFYTRLADEVVLAPGTSPFESLTQSAALNLLFLGGSVAMLMFSVALISA